MDDIYREAVKLRVMAEQMAQSTAPPVETAEERPKLPAEVRPHLPPIPVAH